MKHAPHMISIIIVTYNAVSTVEFAIRSVLQQTYNNKELIVIDGGSTDGTIDKVLGFGPAITQFITERDNGIYDAMNKGIKLAKGNWVYFLGADDEMSDDHILEKVFTQEDIDAAFIYGNVRLRSNNKIFGGRRDYIGLIEHNINHQSIFYNNKIFEKFNGYDLLYPILADYDLNLKIFEDPTIIKLYMPLEICLFQDKGGASNTVVDTNFFSNYLSKFLKDKTLPVAHPALQKYYFYSGLAMFFKGSKKEGMFLILKSLNTGKRKLHYTLLLGKHFLAQAGFVRKTKFT